MHIAVLGNKTEADEFACRRLPADVSIVYVQNMDAVPLTADALFFLQPESELATNLAKLQAFSGVVIVNAVVNTLARLPEYFIRLNAWPGFINRPIAEVAVNAQNRQVAEEVFSRLNWPQQVVADVPGMITPRVVAMLVNEAYFALSDDISSRDQIDTAMKLGTNYPFGPFEWGQKIGLRQIVELLQTMAATDERYVPAPLLVKESQL